MMAQSSYSSVPLAPRTVKFWLSRKLRLQGKRDARKYSQLSDYTRTHAVIVVQNRALAGQREVNQWLINNATPLRVGNARSLVNVQYHESELQRLKTEPGNTPRARRLVDEKIVILRRSISDIESQLESNASQLASLALVAFQARGSWSNYYEQMAGIYSRARANKLKHDVDSVRAEVPDLENIPLVDFEENEGVEITGKISRIK
jgi:hypothetical protein